MCLICFATSLVYREALFPRNLQSWVYNCKDNIEVHFAFAHILLGVASHKLAEIEKFPYLLHQIL